MIADNNPNCSLGDDGTLQWQKRPDGVVDWYYGLNGPVSRWVPYNVCYPANLMCADGSVGRGLWVKGSLNGWRRRSMKAHRQARRCLCCVTSQFAPGRRETFACFGITQKCLRFCIDTAMLSHSWRVMITTVAILEMIPDAITSHSDHRSRLHPPADVML